MPQFDITEDDARLIARFVVDHLKAEGLKVVKADGTAPAKAKADKPAKEPAAAAPAAAPAAEPTKAPAKAATVDRNAVHQALRDYQAKYGKEEALAVLHKYSPTLNGLSESNFQQVIEDLSKPPADSTVSSSASDFD